MNNFTIVINRGKFVNKMYTLEKSYTFEAGHSLCYHDGKCREPHGHSYTLTLHIQSPSLQESGPKKNMVMDFNDIGLIVKPLIKSHLDHHWLNDTLQSDSPTAEYIAKWIFDYLKPKISGLRAVTIAETATSKVTYYGL